MKLEIVAALYHVTQVCVAEIKKKVERKTNKWNKSRLFMITVSGHNCERLLVVKEFF